MKFHYAARKRNKLQQSPRRVRTQKRTLTTPTAHTAPPRTRVPKLQPPNADVSLASRVYHEASELQPRHELAFQRNHRLGSPVICFYWTLKQTPLSSKMLLHTPPKSSHTLGQTVAHTNGLKHEQTSQRLMASGKTHRDTDAARDKGGISNVNRKCTLQQIWEEKLCDLSKWQCSSSLHTKRSLTDIRSVCACTCVQSTIKICEDNRRIKHSHVDYDFP